MHRLAYHQYPQPYLLEGRSNEASSYESIVATYFIIIKKEIEVML